MRRLAVVLAFVAVALPVRALHAAPALGASLPALALEDDAQHVRSLSDGALPIVLVWEDESSSKHKQAAHAVVGRYSDKAANRALFDFVAVADLEHWNYWPARHYARNAFWKQAGRGKGTPVYIDWKGALRHAFDLHAGESAFIVLDRQHRVRYFAQGTLDDAQCAALDAAIAALGATPAR